VLSDATLSDLRTELERERSQLVARLAEMGSLSDGEIAFDQNFADSSQVTAERGEAETLALQLRDALTEVEHALHKLGAGDYGLCESCGKPITPARLEAKPAARTCIDCASKR
jgi:DnaK suppressor protein